MKNKKCEVIMDGKQNLQLKDLALTCSKQEKTKEQRTVHVGQSDTGNINTL